MATPSPDFSGIWLVCVAAEKEADAILRGLGVRETPTLWDPIPIAQAEVLLTGVGKSAAAAGVARFFDPARHAGVLSVGIAGALPGSGLNMGDTVLANPSVFADEGAITPRGFLSLDAMGFGRDAPPTLPDDTSRAALTPLADRLGPVATVSVCSGVDSWAAETARRTGAIAEAMEGAAAALAARRVDPDARFAELRVISNTTGDRSRQIWDLAGALARLGDLLPKALDALRDR